MKRKRMVSVLAIILAALMLISLVVSVLPASAFAEPASSSETISEALFPADESVSVSYQVSTEVSP